MWIKTKQTSLSYGVLIILATGLIRIRKTLQTAKIKKYSYIPPTNISAGKSQNKSLKKQDPIEIE